MYIQYELIDSDGGGRIDEEDIVGILWGPDSCCGLLLIKILPRQFLWVVGTFPISDQGSKTSTLPTE
jgi:hypothetical protein